MTFNHRAQKTVASTHREPESIREEIREWVEVWNSNRHGTEKLFALREIRRLRELLQKGAVRD